MLRTRRGVGWLSRVPAPASEVPEFTARRVGSGGARGPRDVRGEGTDPRAAARRNRGVRRDVRNLEDIAKVYAKYGKTEQQFLDATKSFGVEMKINRTKQMVPRYGVDGTPTVVVAGKYRVTVGSAGSPEKVFDVVNFLVAKEASAKKVAAAAAAPAAAGRHRSCRP